jgi:hypothetical protein
MTANRISLGMIGELKHPVSRRHRAAAVRIAQRYGLGVNKEGTLIYQKQVSKPIPANMDIFLLAAAEHEKVAFCEKVWNAGFETAYNKTCPFVDLSVEGKDHAYDVMTLAEFRKSTGQAS